MAKAKFNPKRLFIVHAHPDDESLFTGHVIADSKSKGAEVMVFTLTRGERGKVKLDELRALEGNLQAMGAFRATELREALAAFGNIHHAFAGTRAYLDSGLRINSMGKPAKPRDLDEMALSAAATAVIADDITKAIKDFNPDVVLTYNSRGGFGHPDHKMAFEATSLAVRRIVKQKRGRAPEFWVIAEPRERFDVEIGDAKTAKLKKAALEAHASQVAVQAETYSVVPGKEIRYDRPERLRRQAISRFAHWKPFLSSFWALPLGVLFAFAGTMLHQVRANDPGQTQLGLIVALIMTASIALGLRLMRRSRGALYLLTAGLSATIFWLSQRQPGGELFIPGNDVGTIWAFGSIGICAFIILFPRVQPGAWRRSSRGHR